MQKSFHPIASAIIVLSFLSSFVVGQELKTRIVGPIVSYDAANLERCDPSWLYVKFAENCDIEIEFNENNRPYFVDKNGANLLGVNQLVGAALQIKPTFLGDRERFREYKRRGELRSGVSGPDLGLWFNVKLKPHREILATTINALNALEVVEISHPLPHCEPAGFLTPIAAPFAGVTPDFSDDQDYLYDPPVGLDAPAAWKREGGRGAGVKFIDVERGWTKNHEDFDSDNFFFDNNVTNQGVFSHGTAVLGEVVGMDNGFGVVGFASDALWGTVGYFTSEWPFVSHRFIEAAEALDPGDIWLIEIQMFPSGLNATPMEYLQANFDAIWTSSFALDVICVEAGANGGQDLDSAPFNGVFDRNVRDSGAILVAAGRPTTLIAESFTNYGSRMDAHGWGSSIVTTGYGDLQGGPVTEHYTASFSGTSGASPMVVGAALCLQGIHKAATGEIILPLDMRQLLADTGTPHNDPVKEIGPRPDIGMALEQIEFEVDLFAESFDLFRGNQVAGLLEQTQESDDSYLKFTPGIVLSSSENPVWIEFTAVSGFEPATLTLTLEASVSSVNIAQTIEAYNFTTETFDTVDSQNGSFNSDSVVMLDLTSGIANYIEPGTHETIARLGWKANGIVLSYPWEVCIDQLKWTVSQ